MPRCGEDRDFATIGSLISPTICPGESTHISYAPWHALRISRHRLCELCHITITYYDLISSGRVFWSMVWRVMRIIRPLCTILHVYGSPRAYQNMSWFMHSKFRRRRNGFCCSVAKRQVTWDEFVKVESIRKMLLLQGVISLIQMCSDNSNFNHFTVWGAHGRRAIHSTERIHYPIDHPLTPRGARIIKHRQPANCEELISCREFHNFIGLIPKTRRFSFELGGHVDPGLKIFQNPWLWRDVLSQ